MHRPKGDPGNFDIRAGQQGTAGNDELAVTKACSGLMLQLAPEHCCMNANGQCSFTDELSPT